MHTHLTPIHILLLFAAAGPAKADKWEQRFPGGTFPVTHVGYTAVWTGTEVIVWGGVRWKLGPEYYLGTELNTGGRYNPATNMWTPTSSAGAPAARHFHTAVWTGTEMIVWGGYTGASASTDTGGRYNPTTNTWTQTSTSSAPIGRFNHTAVWTGSEMFVGPGAVWGSPSTGTGGRYRPGPDLWSGIALGPVSYQDKAFWTGAEVLLKSGWRYHPIAERWTAVSANGKPSGGTAVWTGAEMIVWNGNDQTGGRYLLSEDRWTAVTTSGAPAAREGLGAVWTGKEMIVWGGWVYGEVNGRTSVDQIFTDIYSYTSAVGDFLITSAVLEGGNLILDFPSVVVRSYTLWQSTALAAGTWTDTGLPVLPGTGANLTFTVPAPTPGRRFFRVQADH